MLQVVLAILPVFLILVIGLTLRKRAIVGEEVWSGLDKLVYWVMFPAMLFHKTSVAPIGGDIVLDYALVLLPGIFLSGAAIWLFGCFSGMEKPSISSIYQGAIRHNTYIGFAVVAVLLGEEGLLLAALATAVMVPFVNLLCVTTLITLHGPRDGRSLGVRLLRELSRNPLILSIAAGIAWNLVGIGEIPVISPVLGMLTVAALPLALLCVGAGLRLRAMKTAGMPIFLSSFCKFALLPGVVMVGLNLTNLTGVPAMVAITFASLPTAASAYSLARQLGGDSQLMAGLITMQTLLSVASLPLALTYLPILLS
ncbi:AEC family transporter [Aestuariispira insulae]|uniref:AEC family transporter n=1 Tax=Aestuariispira insulae TaxID=1461337 RepID=A0A3D9HN34_9PROT|nr:AEC family transporter [Aestuariispira insulae]RED50910.1 hypothetical protein DFP90_104182 [Aestuariispira insulae]